MSKLNKYNENYTYQIEYDDFIFQTFKKKIQISIFL